MSIDLRAYFERIGYSGPHAPTFDTLREIHLRHVRAIPFENLDILLGRGIRIDPASLEQKLVHSRRGGYCFEQNGLLCAVLRDLGFVVKPLLARVRWQLPPEVQTALTHHVLLVETADGGPCIADVGYGSMSLLVPLRLEFDREQPGVLEPRRLIRRGSSIMQQARLREVWHDVYQFALDEAFPPDFEVGNWFTSAHPQSRFVKNLVAARPGDGCRYALLNGEFSTRHADGRVEQRTLQSPDELLAVLAEHFDLHFPPGTRFGPPGSPWPS